MLASGRGVAHDGTVTGAARLTRWVAIALGLALVACSGSTAHSDRTQVGTAPVATTSSGLPPAVAQTAPAPVTATTTGASLSGPVPGGGPAGSDWPTYHGDGARSGWTTAGPTGSGSPRRAWAARVDGAVYAVPVAAAGLVVVATEHDVVTALDAETGAVRWSRTLGAPVDAESLPCGDISPSGITGTPVIDTTAGVVHVVAFTAPAEHHLVTLDLVTGAERSRVAVDPPGLDAKVEQQRGALTVANGRVYVPFGGLYGDCGAYKGAMVSAPVADLDHTTGAVAPTLQSWETTARREAALWAPPGPVVGADGSLWVATGNAGHASGQSFDGGDAVVHLTPDLRQMDVFAPSEWRQQAEDDADLGSSSPMLVGGEVVQAGKTGDAYLLDGGRLGGVGGQQASTHACAGVYGGAAVLDGVVYLPCRNGVTALRVSIPPALAVMWHGPSFTAGGPVIAGGAVWAPDLDAGDLVALDPATGAERTRTHVGKLAHFASIGLARGRLVMATTDGTVVAYGP